MTGEQRDFGPVLFRLWMRLAAISAAVFVFAAVFFPNLDRIPPWFRYLTVSEFLFEAAVRLICGALAGCVAGTLIAAAAAVPLWRAAQPKALADRTAAAAAGIAALIASASVLRTFLHWVNPHPAVIRPIAIVGYLIAFAIALRYPSLRKRAMSAFEPLLGEAAARRAALATVLCASALVVCEAWLRTAQAPPVLASPAAEASGPNILLVTFDALSADDMSLYGYRLPTTPHIDEFARRSSVFTNFFSASTFTTPSIAAIWTGLYPSEHRVYQLSGHFARGLAAKTLPSVLRSRGYETAAALSNPFAYFLAEQMGPEYEALPPPAFRTGAFLNIWNATELLHQPQPYGSRVDEFRDYLYLWDWIPTVLATHYPLEFGRTHAEAPPEEVFAEARALTERMPGAFFLHVHVYAPHSPYLPARPYLGRYLPSTELRTWISQYQLGYGGRAYRPAFQPTMDKVRLRYDEFVTEADAAFGAFMDDLERAGKLRNTVVIVSADHGESFEGGVYAHKSKYQTRPEIHVPLIIHLPGQEKGARIAFAADETSVAPTILELAGLPRPDWMRGPSLAPWLGRDGQGAGEGLAFTQYLETDSIFKPLTSGTVGVIDGRSQYVIDLANGQARLRGLAEAQWRDLDRSAENPAEARRLREIIYSRFPYLPRR